MATTLDYVSLSALIYNDQRGGGGVSTTVNHLTPPPGWQALEALGFSTALNSNPFSFTAGAYVNAAGEIVIAYKGTDSLWALEWRSWNTAFDLIADVSAALGSGRP